MIENTPTNSSQGTEENIAENGTPKSRHKFGNLDMLLIGGGVLCCIVGFILMFNSSFGSLQFNVSLYGLTGAGGSSILGGLFLLLG